MKNRTIVCTCFYNIHNNKNEECLHPNIIYPITYIKDSKQQWEYYQKSQIGSRKEKKDIYYIYYFHVKTDNYNQ